MNGRYNNPMKQCPFCGEAIMANAVKCRFCQEFLDNSPPQVKPCMFCGENLDIKATVCDYCGEYLVSSGARQGRTQAPQTQGSYQTEKPYEADKMSELQSGFSTYKLPPAGDDFFPYDDQPPAVGRCNYCGEQLLSLEEGACPFCGTVFADKRVKESPSHPVKECPFCGEFNEVSSIRCMACGEIMKISFGSKAASGAATVTYSDKPRTENKRIEKSIVTGDLQRECLLCGEKNPMNAVKCRVCHEIFSEEEQAPETIAPKEEILQEGAKKRGSLLSPSKILGNASAIQKRDAYPVSQSRGTKQFGDLPASNDDRAEMQKLCPLCGEKNPLSASYCKLCCEELKDKEVPKGVMPSIAPKESVRKSIVTGDLQRECLLCGEKNPATALKCRICNEMFESDGADEVKENMKQQEIPAEEIGEDDYIQEKTWPPEISEENEEKPKPVRRKSHWETTPKQEQEEVRPSLPPVTRLKQEKKIEIKKTSGEAPKSVACPVCGSKLSPSGDCPDCEHKHAELEKLVEVPKKKSTLYPIIITGMGIIFIIALMSVIGTYAYPIFKNILSHPAKPTEVAVVTPQPEPTEMPTASVAVESPVVTPDTSVTPTAVPTEIAVPTPVLMTKVSFVDIEDNFAKNYIIALQKLGIFEEIEANKFKPYDKITRGLYVRWLVKTANILCPEKAITKSLSSLSKNYYDDAQPDYLDFTYIQFLHDQGYIVGIDGTHFEPDKELTREELMMIRCSFEYDIQYTDVRDLDHAKCILQLENYLRDPNDINKPYLVSFYKDMSPGFPVLNRSFGRIKKIYPKVSVTRSEAAASLGEILGRSAEETVEKLLSPKSESNSQTPTQ